MLNRDCPIVGATSECIGSATTLGLPLLQELSVSGAQPLPHCQSDAAAPAAVTL